MSAGIAVAVAEDVVAQHDVGEPGGEPGEGDPRLEKALLLLGVEAVEVVGDPQRVEVGQRIREDVLLLVHHDRLEVTPSVPGDRRQPSEFRHVDRLPGGFGERTIQTGAGQDVGPWRAAMRVPSVTRETAGAEGAGEEVW